MDGILSLLGEEDKLVGANMPSELLATHGVMEGGGSYNLHARLPAGGASLALPFLEEAVRNTRKT